MELAHITKLSLYVMGVATALAMAHSSTTSAQTATEIAPLENVVVIAQRRTENQQDVPISVTVVTDEFLINNNVRTLEDLNGALSGFVTTDTVGYGSAPLSIRGIGGANGGGNVFNDEPVAVYVDGVYIAHLTQSTADLIDVESIQILRGPQGTLYGRNSTAGAVLLTTARPTDEMESTFRAGFTSFGDYNGSAVISGPLGATISGRAVIGYSDRRGFGTNTVNGSDIGGVEDFTGRLSFRFAPRDSVTFVLIGQYQDRSANPALLAVTGVGETGIASPFVQRTDLDAILDSRDFELNDRNFADSQTYSLTLNGDLDLGLATLTTITSYRDWALDGTQDSDSTGLQLFNNNGNIESEQFSQEIRLASNSDGPLSWLLGGFYLEESSTLYFDVRNYQGLFALGTEANFDAAQDTKAYSVFADVSYDITSRLSLTVGGRYSRENKDFVNDQIVTILNGGTLPPFFLDGATLPAGAVFVNPPAYVDSASFNDFSPRVVIDFKVNDDLLLYASYNQGFKSGGFNSFGLAPAFESENVDAFEIGAKADLVDGRVRLNASAFSYDYSNLQIRLPVPTGGVDIKNVGASDILGFEIEAAVRFVDGFTVAANIAVLDTEITEGMIPAISSTTPPLPLGAPLPLTLEDVSGNVLTRAPEFQGAINASYEKPIGSFIFVVSASFKYQSSVFFLETNQDTNTYQNEAWEELDMRTSIVKLDKNWEFAIYGQNILDNRHITAVTAFGGFPNASVNEPRKWGAEALVRF